MALTYSKQNASNPTTPGAKAPPFRLKSTDDQWVTLDTFSDKKALLIIFMCNHCPYVIAVQDRLNAIAKKYAEQTVSVVGINPNDSTRYPDDSFEEMKKRTESGQIQFTYLVDETQAVAKAYDAVCTPDLYLYENVAGEFRLRYHGRIDDNWKESEKVTKRELENAIDQILKNPTLAPTELKFIESTPSMGCSIKWKSA